MHLSEKILNEVLAIPKPKTISDAKKKSPRKSPKKSPKKEKKAMPQSTNAVPKKSSSVNLMVHNLFQ